MRTRHRLSRRARSMTLNYSNDSPNAFPTKLGPTCGHTRRAPDQPQSADLSTSSNANTGKDTNLCQCMPHAQTNSPTSKHTMQPSTQRDTTYQATQPGNQTPSTITKNLQHQRTCLVTKSPPPLRLSSTRPWTTYILNRAVKNHFTFADKCTASKTVKSTMRKAIQYHLRDPQ